MDFWIANLADGSTKEEQWLEGLLSPWQRLMIYCKEQNTYLTGLRLVMGDQIQACPDNAIGYWQAHGIPTVQGIDCDEELHTWKGIGWVVDGIVTVIWAARDPKNHNTVWWKDARAAENQAQVIWAPKAPFIIPMEDRMEVVRGTAKVKNIKKFSDRIVEDAGGLKEVYVPGHNKH